MYSMHVCISTARDGNTMGRKWVYLRLLYTYQTVVNDTRGDVGRFAKKSKDAPMHRSLTSE
jgi:hypothetical protein